jgi:hypothetical protein
VYRWYAAADILVVPSRYEPFGMVVLEGMLHGLPVVAAEVGGPADILEHGRTGLLFPPRDVTALVAALRKLIGNTEDRRRMGHAAAREVRQTWLWDRLVPEMIRVYGEFRPNAPRQTTLSRIPSTEGFISARNSTGVALSGRRQQSSAYRHRDRLDVAVRVEGFLYEEEVIAIFLQAEIGSSRFARALLEILRRDRMDRVVVDRPDLGDDRENKYRQAVLSELRDWGTSCGFFAGFPARVNWCRATLSWDELMMVRYANLPHWLYLSGGSRSARDAARRLRASLMPEIDLNFYEAIGNALSRGAAPHDLIMAGSSDGNGFVLIDGHARLTALALADQSSLREFSTVIALTEDLFGWVGH